MEHNLKKVLLGQRDFISPLGPCMFLFCVKEFHEKAKAHYPDAQWPKIGQIYSPTSVYGLQDNNQPMLIPFVHLKEISINERVGYLLFNFKPFPFSPN